MAILQKTTLKLHGQVYRIVGVVLHVLLGNGVGHYTAFVRSRYEKVQWYYVDEGTESDCKCKTFLWSYVLCVGDACQCCNHIAAGPIYAF